LSTFRKPTLAVLAALGGLVLFAYAVRRAGGLDEVFAGIRRVGWGLGPILAIAGLRFALRAECWRRCMPPATRMPFGRAFTAYLSGDAIGNLTPLGLAASEPTKIFLIRHQLATRDAASSLAVDLLVYAVSAVAMIAAGTVVSGTLATLTVAANVISPESLVAVTLAGVFGSVLPDIDLRDSRPSRAFFSGLGIFLSFCVLFAVAHRYSIAEMWIVWLGTLVAVRYGLQFLFLRFSAHRGIWHSIVAGLFFWFLTAIVFHRLLGYHEGVAWLAGGFLFIGYITHLILDELYSVDVFDTRIKASFGSALKLYDGKHLGDTAVVTLACVVAFALAPPARSFVDGKGLAAQLPDAETLSEHDRRLA